MGSLYELRYTIAMKDDLREKEFIDALRCRNGNLTICCGIKPSLNTQYILKYFTFIQKKYIHLSFHTSYYMKAYERRN